MGGVPDGVCYLIWFAALRRLSPFVASTAMLLVPIVGITSAAVLLGEAIGSGEVVAMMLALGGVAMVLRHV